MSDFTFGLWTLDGTRISPIESAFERKATLPFNGMSTALTRTSIDDDISDEILSRKGDVILTVHQGTTVRFCGELMTGELITRTQENKPPQLMCTFAGPLWKLKERLIGMPYPLARSSWTDWPTDLILKDILDWANTDDAGFIPPLERNTGIRWNPANPTLFKTTVGLDPKWLMKPGNEGLTDLQEARIPFPIVDPPTWVGKDDLGAPTPYNLDGSSDVESNLWRAPPRNGMSYTSQSNSLGQVMSRGTPTGLDSNWHDGGMAINDAMTGPDLGAYTLCGVDWYSNVTPGSGKLYYPAVVARLQDYTSATPVYYATAVIDVNTSWVSFWLRMGTSLIMLKAAALPTPIIPSTWYGLRLLVDRQGNYTVWHYAYSDVGRPNAPVLEGQHAELVSPGGTLYFGKGGFHEALTQGTDVARYYRNFFVCDNTDPQSFDFRFTPVEPTPESPVTTTLAAEWSVWQPTMTVASTAGFASSGSVRIGLTTIVGYTSRSATQFLGCTASTGTGTFPVGTTATGAAGLKIATLDLALQFGSQKPNAVFEHGSSSKDYKLLIDRQGMVNRAVSLDPTGGTDIRIGTDVASHAIRGAREAVIPSDFGNASLRQALVDAHASLRNGPRRMIDFQGSQRAPIYGVDYVEGDWVPARAKHNGKVRFGDDNGQPEWARVFSVEIGIDELGNLEVIPTLVPVT